MSTIWEDRYRTGDIPWEKGEAAPPLVDWLTKHEISGRILVPGCGTGHDVRALARAGSEPLGLDIAPSAIELANLPPRAGREEYRLANFFELPPELRGAFDWVFEHTCFCAIDPSLRSDYVAESAAVLKPGGKLLAIFYLDPGQNDGPPYGATREELDALFSGHFQTVEEYIPTASYPGREGCELVRVLSLRS